MALLPSFGFALLATALSGWLMARIGAKRVMVMGLILSALGSFGFVLIDTQASYLLLACILAVLGFGLALISTPILLFVYEPRTVVVLTAIFSIFINAAVAWDSWHEARRRLALALFVPALFGIVVGAMVLGVVNPIYIRLGVGAIVIFSALLLVRDIRLPGANTRWGTLFAGSASGALATSTGLAGPPIVLLLASRAVAASAGDTLR